MKLGTLEPSTTALILIDLQHGILGLPLTPYSAEQLLGQATQLVDAFRKANGTVVRVRVDLAQLRHPLVDNR